MNAEAMRRPSDDKFIENERQNPLVSVCLPILAVFLHLRVFFHAVACLSTTFTDKLPIQDSLVNLTLIDRYVCSAYSFDLICCYVFKTIPFSRCYSSSDIAGHHLPILLLFLPLCVPAFFQQFQQLDPLFHNIVGHSKDDGNVRMNFLVHF